MSSYFEISYFKRLSKVNLYLLAIYLGISITAHVIANRLILVHGYPVISAGLIYMMIFVLTDVFTTFNSRKFAIMIIFLESMANLFLVSFTIFINNQPHPDFFLYAEEYKIVFSPLLILVIANICGSAIAALVDVFIFYYLYRVQRWMFFLASFLSSIITVTTYTYITDYFGFRNSFPEHVLQITHVNIASNFITLLIYSFIGQILVYCIHRYLNSPSIKAHQKMTIESV
ncbi:MAG: VUT family protein [Gammaproteobacteria bacterium]